MNSNVSRWFLMATSEGSCFSSDLDRKQKTQLLALMVAVAVTITQLAGDKVVVPVLTAANKLCAR